jgi:hypothetical protein
MQLLRTRKPERVLRQADTLLADERWSEAIALLQQHNRREAHADVERRIVDLLLQASEHVPAPGRVESTQASDPGARKLQSAGPGSLPEVAAAELTPTLLKQALGESGHLVVRGYLAAGETAPLRHQIDNILQARVRTESGAARREDPAWYYPSPHFPGKHVSYSRRNAASKFGQTGSVPVLDSPRGTFNLIEVFRKAGLDRLLADYFSDQPVIATRKWMFRLVEPRQDVDNGIGGGWHQDGQFMGDSINTVNLWIALSECGDTADAPGIAIIPRRFRELLEFGTRGARLDWTVGAELVAEIAADTPMVRPHFNAGDALFFDHLSLHRTGHASGQTARRYAIESWFYAASAHGGRPITPVFLSQS